MRRFVWWPLLLVVVFVFAAGLTPRQRQRELDEVEIAIEHLEKSLLLHRAQGLWYLDLGTRLQFKRNRFRESQQAFEEAKLQFQAVDMIESRLRHLKRRRQDLLRGR